VAVAICPFHTLPRQVNKRSERLLLHAMDMGLARSTEEIAIVAVKSGPDNYAITHLDTVDLSIAIGLALERAPSMQQVVQLDHVGISASAHKRPRGHSRALFPAVDTAFPAMISAPRKKIR
jgi:hypothetical protein